MYLCTRCKLRNSSDSCLYVFYCSRFFFRKFPSLKDFRYFYSFQYSSSDSWYFDNGNIWKKIITQPTEFLILWVSKTLKSYKLRNLIRKRLWMLHFCFEAIHKLQKRKNCDFEAYGWPFFVFEACGYPIFISGLSTSFKNAKTW